MHQAVEARQQTWEAARHVHRTDRDIATEQAILETDPEPVARWLGKKDKQNFSIVQAQKIYIKKGGQERILGPKQIHEFSRHQKKTRDRTNQQRKTRQ